MLSNAILPPVLALCAVQCLIIALITHIFPFIAAFLLSLNVPPEKVATYSGMAESLVSIGDLHVKLIQILPHRQLIIASLFLSGLVASLMGFSTHIWQILLLRGLTALFSFGGFLASIALGEVVKGETGSQAFSFFASATFLGAMLGSVIGGYLAEPEGRVPFLGGADILVKHPYIAPGLAMGILTVICAIVIWLMVPETNAKYRHCPVAASTMEDETRPIQPQSDEGKITLADLWHDIRFWHLNVVDILNKACFFTCLTVMSTAGKLSPELGGLGLSIQSIGMILFFTPLLTSCNLVFLFPLYSDKILTRWILIVSSSAWVLTAIFFPIATQTAIPGKPHQTPIYVLWYLGHAIGMIWWALQGSLTLALYHNTADRALAAGILQQSGNVGYILGVAGSSQLLSLSSQYPIGTTGRQAIWIWLMVLACLTVLAGACLPERARSNDVELCEDEEAVTINERTPLL